MAYDPVLDREMFRPRSRGVEELRDTEESDSVRARREQALAMIEAAKKKFDPANYQTLTEQDRPGVFRPVAVNIPAQQQTADTAMRMQQMAAQGVRPVGMARGGSVAHFADGGYNPYAGVGEDPLVVNEKYSRDEMMDSPPIRPTIESENTESDEEYFDRLAKLRKRLKEVRDMPVRAETNKEERKSSFDMRGTVPPRTDSRGAVLQMTPEEIATMDAGGKGLPVMNPNEAYYSRRAPFTGELLRLPVERSRTVGPIEAYGTEAEMEKVLRQQAAPDRRDYASEREYTANVLADQAAREQAYPDRRDYASERNYAANVLADQTAREQAAPDRRDYAGERAFNASNLRALEDAALREQAAPDKRDYASEREARGLAALRDSVRTGDQPGAIADASRPASGIRSGEEKAAAPDTSRGGAPSTGAPATGGAPAAGGVGSFKAAGESVDSGPMTLEGIRAERAREREENINLGLIQAGLAIMGGKSSNALANIGEGAQAGIRQFATQEAESKKNMRDVMRDIRQERLTRDEMALRERLSAAQIEATSNLAAAQRESTESMFKQKLGEESRQFGIVEARQTRAMDIADNHFKQQFGLSLAEAQRNASQFEKTFGLSVSEATRKAKEFGDDLAYKYDALAQLGKRDEAENLLKSRGYDIEEQKLKQLPESARTAAAIAGWDPRSNKSPSADQILTGLSRMKETDEMDTLEKIARDPLVDENLRKKASERLTSIIDARMARSPRSPSTPKYTEGQTATGPNGQKIIYKNGQWVNQ
jgi:hypothetical protein